MSSPSMCRDVIGTFIEKKAILQVTLSPISNNRRSAIFGTSEVFANTKAKHIVNIFTALQWKLTHI